MIRATPGEPAPGSQALSHVAFAEFTRASTQRYTVAPLLLSAALAAALVASLVPLAMRLDTETGVALQPFVDLGRLVEGDAVEDDVNLGSGLDPLGDKVEESEEFLRAITLDHPASDFSGNEIEGRHQAGGEVAPVIVGAGLETLPVFFA